ncbi:MAG: 4-(cytidine 5'-diphospho)-2-C-methyl-D-erythritol kinase [Bacteroidota bacterium]
MLRLAPAKINLGLTITGKRPDGYHELESVVLPIPFYDILEVLPQSADAEDELIITGIRVDGPADQNLVIKALQLFRAVHPCPPLKICLHKQIPAGAGLGGGSSDGTAMLSLLNEMFDHPLNTEELHDLAARLGSDCPLFLYDSPSLMTGRGELIEPLSFSTGGMYLVLLFPGLKISTREAYSKIVPRMPEQRVRDLIREPVGQWRNRLVNDFEEALFPFYPRLKELSEALYRQGAVYASLSGSGSALYGLFSEPPAPGTFPEDLLVWKGRLA